MQALATFAKVAIGLMVVASNLALLISHGLVPLAKTYAARDITKAAEVLQAGRGVSWLSASPARELAEMRLQRDPVAAAASFRTALAQRPIDAGLWSRYAIAALFAGETRHAEAATAMALQLAPNTVTIALEQAAVGGQFYDQVSPQTQRAWRDAASLSHRLRWTITRDYLVAHHREQTFCRLVDPASEVMTWCRMAPEFRKVCRTADDLSLRQQQRCRRMGYPPEHTP